jgi:hypothetical protein
MAQNGDQWWAATNTNEPSCSIKGKEHLDLLNNNYLLKKLVNFYRLGIGDLTFIDCHNLRAVQLAVHHTSTPIDC